MFSCTDSKSAPVGPRLPHTIATSTVVPYGDTFAVVGGKFGGLGSQLQDTVYIYNPKRPGWDLLKNRLGKKRDAALNVAVPKEFFPPC